MINVSPDGSAAPRPPVAEPETVTDLSGASVVLSTAVIVTVPVLAVPPAAIVNVLSALSAKSPDVAGAAAAADTVIVTASPDGCESAAVTAVTLSEPLSSTVDAESDSVAVGAASSSTMVSVAEGGDSAPLPPSAAPETVTILSAESVLSGVAVTVTEPLLVVSPAAIVNVVPVCLKSVPAPGEAETETVVAALETPLSVAVTVETPPASAIDAGDSASRVVGVASSSASVSVTLAGDAIPPPPPETVPDTVTDLSGESTALSFAVTVTEPVLVVAPAAIVNVSVGLNVKSAASAPAPAAAATVTVTAALDAPESAAVTVAAPPFSETDDDDSTSAAVGGPSSSRIVNVASAGSVAPSPGAPDAEPETVTLLCSASLSAASIALSTAVTVTVPVLVVSPAAIVNVSALDNVKSPDIAGGAAAADTVSVTAAAEGFESVAVTVETPPASVTDAGVSASDEPGRASSSTMVNVRSEGAATRPCPPATVPPTVAVSFSSSVASSTAVTVTAPELVVAPAAMVSVLSLDRLKSPAAAVAPVAETVTVIASPEIPPLRLAVTVVALPAPLSAIVSGVPPSGSDSASASVGVGSSSVIVPTPIAALPSTAPPVGLLSAIRTVSFGSSSASPLTVTVKLLLVSAAPKVSVPPAMAV